MTYNVVIWNTKKERTDMDKNLTISMAAKLLERHPETVRRLNRKGFLKAKRNFLGHRIFAEKDVISLKRKMEKLSEQETR